MLWKATYTNGEEVWENPSTGTKDLDRSRLARFDLTESGVIRHTVYLDPAHKLIYRRRAFLAVIGEAPQDLTIVGWNDGETGSLIYVHEDGRTEHRTDLTDIELLEEEK